MSGSALGPVAELGSTTLLGPPWRRAAVDEARLAGHWVLVLEHRDRALRVARARSTSREDAEDLVQEALIRAVALPRLYPETLGGLISTIVIRLAIEHGRRRLAKTRAEERIPCASPPDEVDEQICDTYETRWFAQQLSRLRTRDLDVFLLRAEGLDTKTAAARLGMSYKAAESAFGRARVELRRQWAATL